MRAIRSSAGIQPKNILRIIVGTFLVLSIPLIAMLFTDEVIWDLYDFLVAGGLLAAAGIMFELIARKLNSRKERIALGVGIVAIIFVVWVELAVGIFD